MDCSVNTNNFTDQLTQTMAATAAPAPAPASVNTDFYPSDPYYTYESSAINDLVFPSMLSPSLSSEEPSPVENELFDTAFDFKPAALTTSPTLDLDELMTMEMPTCQPTPVHSRSQSYSYGHEMVPNPVQNPEYSPNPEFSPNSAHTEHDHSECSESDSEEELSLDDSPSANGILFKHLTHDEQSKYRKYHCPVCKKYFRRDLPRHLRIHQRVARFVCPYPREQCTHKRGQFNRPYDYKKHLLHSHFQFDEAKLVRGFRDLKSKLSHHGTCNCGRRFRADKWLDEHVMKCLKEQR